MIIVCPNCQGFRATRNKWNQLVSCPTCGNRGFVDRVEQVNIYGSFDVIIEKLQPDQRVKYKRGVA